MDEMMNEKEQYLQSTNEATKVIVQHIDCPLTGLSESLDVC